MDKFFSCVILAVCLCLCSCAERDEENHERYLDAEISSRLSMFAQHDTSEEVVKRVKDIHRLAGQLILLSKDVENPGASVSRGNLYFNELAMENGFAYSALTKLHPGMSLDEISAAIKSNELYVLNCLSAEHYPLEINMQSVH